MPLINYADVVYDGANVKETQLLQRLQKGAMRIILNTDRYAHIEDMHQNLNLIPLDLRRKHHVCHQTYKGLHGIAPNYIVDKLQIQDSRHSMNTRSTERGMLLVKPCRLHVCSKNFFVKGPKIWNPIESDIKSRPTLEQFKRNLYLSSIIVLFNYYWSQPLIFELILCIFFSILHDSVGCLEEVLRGCTDEELVEYGVADQWQALLTAVHRVCPLIQPEVNDERTAQEDDSQQRRRQQ